MGVNKLEKVSVIVTVFNHVAYVGQCLESILSQEGGVNLEVLVGDDGSSDGSRDILLDYKKRFPENIFLFLRERRLGASENIRDLLSRATGDYIAHMDGDDYWLCEKISKQVDFLHANDDVVGVYTSAKVVDSSGKCIGDFNNAPARVFGANELLLNGNFLHTSSMVYRAEYKQQVIAIDGEFIDYRIHFVLASNGGLAQLPIDGSVYRKGVRGGMTSVMREEVAIWYYEAILEARRRGASQQLVLHALKKSYRVAMYHALSQFDFAQMRRFHYRFMQDAKEAGATFSSLLFNCAISFPFLVWRHLRRKFSVRKIFFEVQ